MRRLDVVQLAIIIVGILVLYKFFYGLPEVILSFVAWINSGLHGGDIMQAFFSTFIWYVFYFAVAFLCIKKSKSLANWICAKGDFSADINLALDKKAILYVVFVSIGVYGLIQNLPKLLVTAFAKIKNSNSFMEDDIRLGYPMENIIIKVFTVGLYFALMFYASVFADYLAGKINNAEPEDEIAENTTDDSK